MIIALLGTGLMGAPMTRCLQAAGHEMHVWNRSIEKAEALADVATVHASAVDAVKHADIVPCCSKPCRVVLPIVRF